MNILTLKLPQIQSQSIYFSKISWGDMPPNPLSISMLRMLICTMQCIPVSPSFHMLSKGIILCPPVIHYISFRLPLTKILKETLTFTYPHIRTHTKTHTHKYVRTYVRTHKYTHTKTHTYTHTYTHMRKNTQIQTHTQTHTNTHMYTHICTCFV